MKVPTRLLYLSATHLPSHFGCHQLTQLHLQRALINYEACQPVNLCLADAAR